MPIQSKQLKKYVVRPALEWLRMSSPSAIKLVMGTCAQESHLGTYIHQLGEGPALGIFQMEPATYKDIWDNYIRFKPGLRAKMEARWGYCPESDIMIYDLFFAAVMCRLHYRRIRDPLPTEDDIHGIANYWKRFYNTHKGKGTANEFVTNYWEYVIA